VKRLKLGDIIEIPTRKGLAFAQYTHHHPQFGWLIRVLPGFYPDRPPSLRQVVDQPARFSIFFPLAAAVNQGLFAKVGNEPIPERDRPFPIFREVMPGTKVWWLWDGERSWRVGDLTEEQRKMPLRWIVNHKALLDMIESGWTPERES
jgi:hypothetical protein